MGGASLQSKLMEGWGEGEGRGKSRCWLGKEVNLQEDGIMSKWKEG